MTGGGAQYRATRRERPTENVWKAPNDHCDLFYARAVRIITMASPIELLGGGCIATTMDPFGNVQEFNKAFFENFAPQPLKMRSTTDRMCASFLNDTSVRSMPLFALSM